MNSMELSKNYLPATVEEKWYQQWMDKGYFRSKPDGRQPFTVVIPPPNVTGVLHLGHTLNETVQDILVRRARMSGFNACWVPGSDHASIATEAKVVNMLKQEKGIEKSQLTREEFLKYAFEWKDKYGDIIYHQIKKLGCSCDWDRVTFTMDDHYYKAVITVFIDLYKKGVIYRGARMINWDPKAKTALSDEEVEYKDLQGKLYHVKYAITDANGTPTGEYITIATQRPETIMGDTAICVNPTDERYKHLKGKRAIIPLIDRLRTGVTALVATTWVAVGATVIFLVAGIVARQLVLPAQPLSWAWIIGLGTISTAVAFSLFLHGLEALGPMTAAIVTTAEPFFVAILAALVLHQPIRVQTVIGGSLIAIAVLILQLHRATDPHPKEGF